MPDANLFRQNVAGVVFWTGIFEKDPVALLIQSKAVDSAHVSPPYYTLFKITGLGSLVEMCEFQNGSGKCNFTQRQMQLRVQTDSQTAYISTIEKPKPAQQGHTQRERARASTWTKSPPFDIPHVGDWYSRFFYREAAEAAAAFAEDDDDPAPRATPVSTRVLDPMRDCFEFLGVSNRPTEDQIKAAFRPKIKQWHPDSNPNNKVEAEKKTRELVTAFDECMRRMGYRKPG